MALKLAERRLVEGRNQFGLIGVKKSLVKLLDAQMTLKKASWIDGWTDRLMDGWTHKKVLLPTSSLRGGGSQGL